MNFTHSDKDQCFVVTNFVLPFGDSDHWELIRAGANTKQFPHLFGVEKMDKMRVFWILMQK